MSSYLSSPYNIQTPQESVNVQLVGNVLTSLNNKYDLNKSIIDQTLAKYESLRGLREQDNQYIVSKIKEAESAMKSYGNQNGNLAYSNVKDTMLSALSNVYKDPFVQSAVLAKAKVDQYDMQVDAIKKSKESDKYNAANYQYGKYKAGVDSYMKGETDTIGNLEYIEYVDKTKVALDTIKQLKELRGKQVIETVDPYDPTKTIKKTIDGLSADEIFRYMPELLPTKVDQQIEVDAWAKYSSNPDKANSDFEMYSKLKLERAKENLDLATTGKNNKTLSVELQKEMQEKYNNALKEQENTLQNLEQFKKANYIQKATYLERNSWMTSIANAAKAKESIEEGNNENYFAKADLELKIEKNEREKEKNAIDLRKAQAEIDATTGVSSGNSSSVIISAMPGDLLEKITPFSDQEQQYGTIIKDINSTILQTVNEGGIPKTVVDNYTAILATKGYDKDGNVIKGKEELASKTPKSTALYDAYIKSNMSKYDSETAGKVHEAVVKRDLLGTDVAKVRGNSLLANWNKNNDSYVNQLILNIRGYHYYPTNENDMNKLADYLKIDRKEFLKLPEKQKERLVATTVYNNIDGSIKDADKQKELLKLSQLVPAFQEHTQITANAVKKTQINAGTNPYFTTGNLATLPANSPEAKFIIDRLPNDQKSDKFDSKSSLSFYKTPEGTIKFIQNTGLGQNEKQGIYSKPPAEISVGKQDDLYAVAQQLIDIDSSRQTTNASKTKQAIPSIKENQTYLVENRNIITEATKATSKLPIEIFNGVNPSKYTNKTETKEVLQGKFGNVVDREKLSQLTDVLATNMRSVKLSMIPVKKQWSIDLQLSNGYQVVEDMTDMQTIDPSFNNVFKEYPQVLITHSIINELSMIQEPEELKKRVEYYINNFR